MNNNKRTHEIQIDTEKGDIKSYSKVIKEIKKQFYQKFQAKINVNYPYIISYNNNNNLLSALGLRPANNNKLYVENYFQDCIEDIINNANIKNINVENITRKEVIEIGSFCSNRPINAFILLKLLVGLSSTTKYKWAVFTATESLVNFLTRQNYEINIISDAHKNNNKDLSSKWGIYYDCNPKIIIMNIEKSYKNIHCVKKNHIFISSYQKDLLMISKIIN